MNVLYVGELPPRTGGASLVAASILRGLAEAGDSVRALAPWVPEPQPSEDVFTVLGPRVAVSRYALPYLVNGWFRGMTRDYRLLERQRVRHALTALIRDAPPDVVLFGKTVYAWHGADLVAALGLPSVMLCQGDWPRELAQHPEADDLLAHVRRVSHIVAVARHLVPPLRRLGLTRVRAVPNGIDLTRFAPGPRNQALLQQSAIPPASVVVLHVSNLVEAKRPLDLVHSAAAALQEAPGLLYVVVGDGPYRARMEASCQELGLASRFRFLGEVPHAHMPEYFTLADVVVMPSESEAFPLVYLEAQACGRALLVSDIPAAREIVVDRDNGLLFRMGDVVDLAGRTVQVARHAAFRDALGRRARVTVQEYSLDRMIIGHRRALLDAVTPG